MKILFSILLFASSLAAKPTQIEKHTYKTVGDRELSLFIVKPANWKPSDEHPAIVWFHGGGWTHGSHTQFEEQSADFAKRGVVSAMVEYRFVKSKTREAPVMPCRDAKSAMRWVRSHAAELGVDPNRIAAAGGSAGAHLSAFATLVEGTEDTQDDLKISPKANALILYNPVIDNGSDNGWGHERIGKQVKQFSPAHNVTPEAPPTLIMVGDEDELIPVSTMNRFKDNMEKFGVRCDLLIHPGGRHGFYLKQPVRGQTTQQVDAFLVSLGWIKSSAE